MNKNCSLIIHIFKSHLYVIFFTFEDQDMKIKYKSSSEVFKNQVDHIHIQPHLYFDNVQFKKFLKSEIPRVLLY